MANPFDESSDYGTLSGQSTGFRPRRAGDFSRLQKSVTDAVLVIKQNTQTLRQLYHQITLCNESVRRQIAQLQRNSLLAMRTATSGLSDLFEITRGSADSAQTFVVKSIHQSVQKAVNEFNSISESIVQKMPEPPRGRGSLRYLDSGEVEVEGETSRLLQPPTQQQQQEHLEAAHMEENAERMEKLEQDIGTLHQLMNEIAQMALIRGDTIDQCVEEVYGQVERGNQKLGTNRSSTCCPSCNLC